MQLPRHEMIGSAAPARWIGLLPVIVVADLLFVPRMLFAFGIPASLLIVMIALLREKLSLRGMACFVVLVLSMLASVIFGTASVRNAVPAESFKRVLQLTTILFYAFYRFDADGIQDALVKVFRAFYIYLFCLTLLFYLDADLYEMLFSLIYPEAMDEMQSNFEHLRFAYFFTDPNSTGYFICFTLAGYLCLERAAKWAMVCGVLATMTVITTQSRGAYVALLLIFSHLLFLSEARRGTKFGVVAFIALALAAIAFTSWDEIMPAYGVFEARFDQEDDLGGGRIDKYAYFLENLNLLPFGPGYHVRRDGIEFRPHSDLIRLNLAYGLLALPALLHFVLPRRKSQVLLFVVFVIPFLINTVVDDYRLFPMYLLLLTLLGQVGRHSITQRRPHSGAAGSL